MLERILNKIFEEIKINNLYSSIQITVDTTGEVIFYPFLNNKDFESQILDEKITELVQAIINDFNHKLMQNFIYYPKKNEIEVNRKMYYLQTEDKIFTEILNISKLEREEEDEI